MNMRYVVGLMLLFTLSSCSILKDKPQTTDVASKEADTVSVKAFDLPVSALMSDESKKALEHYKNKMETMSEPMAKCPSIFEVTLAEVEAARECNRQVFYQSEMYKDLLKKYPVDIEKRIIGGVYTEIFTPKGGHADINHERVLVNMHGGGFVGGSQFMGRLESIPIAVLGKIKVISIDYRMAPEYRFPAASEDVAAVYRELIKTYQPKNIGLFGYSAGGVLAAQSVALFQKEEIPLPGAIGMIAGAAGEWNGDLMHIGGAISGMDLLNYEVPVSYFDGIDESDPLVRPAGSDDILAKFPPSILVSATRDFALSNVIYTHRQLLRLGVEADLHVWEGMGHELIAAFYTPEAQEAYGMIIDFFEQHLGLSK